jgi:OOP family OmpA-OmpF porin
LHTHRAGKLFFKKERTMNRFLKLGGVVLATVTLAGCSGGMRLQQPWCSVIGGLVGGGAGIGVNEAISDDPDTEERAIAGGAGALVGATAGALLCAPRKAPEPVAQVQPAAPADSDGDGVPDNRDKCPGTPAGTRVDANGCPEVGESLARLQDVYFDFNKATLKPGAGPTLDQAASSLKANPKMTIRLEGHTDSVGSDGYNLRLSQRRADAVRRYLAGQGIEAGRLDSIGKGESQPVASNASNDGRAQTRRVEFIVSGK